VILFVTLRRKLVIMIMAFSIIQT